jgi:pyruvate/2-oxoacid:ferredoxin oxidoreductase beta subunit
MLLSFRFQIKGAEGFSMVEVLSPCPTYWRMTPAKAMEWIEKEMTKVFPLGRFKG